MMLKDHGTLLDKEMPPSTLRKMLYQAYVRFVQGSMGRGNRIVVPKCVASIIRDIFPDPEGNYMGHKDS